MSAALVRVGTRAAGIYGGYYGRPTKRARLAYYGARAAWSNRKAIGRAATKIARWYRRRRGRKPYSRRVHGARRTGRSMGAVTYATTRNTKTLYEHLLAFPDMSGTSIGHRQSHSIRLSGIKCCWEFINNQDYPIEVHWALCQYKTQGEQSIDFKTDFFRDPAGTTTRTTSFTDGGANWFLAYKCLGINPDRFNIVTHKRKILDSRTGGGTDSRSTREALWYWKINKYYKLNKTVTFENAADTQPMRPYVIFYWWVSVRRADYNSAHSAVAVEQDDRIYFRPSK